MGQARQRKAEIDALKASSTAVSFVAIRHLKDGKPEFVHATVDLFGQFKAQLVDVEFLCLGSLPAIL